jgi:hypothetical protein
MWGRERGRAELVDISPSLYLNEHLHLNGAFCECSWFFWHEVFWLVKLYSYLFAGSASVPMADALVEGPDKDG